MLEDEQGSVYFRQVMAANTKGNMAANDVITDPRNAINTPQNYATSLVEGEVKATVAATLTYAFNTAVVPVRSSTLVGSLDGSTDTVYFEDVGVKAGDAPGTGRILGQGVSGTIVYATGAVTLVFAADPGNGQITYSYQQNLEEATDLPIIKDFYDHKYIRARAFALKGTIGMLKSFALRKRFNMNSEEGLSRLLVENINAEIGGALIKKLVQNSPNAGAPVQFDKTPPTGVSFFEHKQFACAA